MNVSPAAAFGQLNSALARIAGLLNAVRDGTINEAECADAMGVVVFEAAVAWAHLAVHSDAMDEIAGFLAVTYGEGA